MREEVKDIHQSAENQDSINIDLLNEKDNKRLRNEGFTMSANENIKKSGKDVTASSAAHKKRRPVLIHSAPKYIVAQSVWIDTSSNEIQTYLQYTSTTLPLVILHAALIAICIASPHA